MFLTLASEQYSKLYQPFLSSRYVKIISHNIVSIIIILYLIDLYLILLEICTRISTFDVL